MLYAKKLSFASSIFRSESFEGGFQRNANLNGYFKPLQQCVFFKVGALVFEGSRETDQKKIDRPCIKPVSQQYKL